MKLRKTFLISLIVSLAVAAALGVMGLLVERYFDSRLLGSMGSIALFSLTMLGAAIVLDKRRWRTAMLVSLAISALGMLYFLAFIWLENLIYDFRTRQILGRWMVQIAIVAVALPLAGLLALTQFEGAALRMVRIAFIICVFIAAAVVSYPFWDESVMRGYEYAKVMLITLILAGLGVVCLPLLHRLVGLPPPSETVAMDVKVQLACPRCGLSQEMSTGMSRCGQCRLRFMIEVEEPRCPGCSYLLYKLTEPRCPECGREVNAMDVIPAASVAKTPDFVDTSPLRH